MTDKELDEFIYVGENKFIELAMIFGDAWVSKSMQIAAEHRAMLAQAPVATMYVQPTRHRVISAEILDDSQVPDDEWFNVYTAPTKKEWVGLTDADWIIGKRSADYIAGAEWAEAKLKEKNNGNG